MVPLPLRGKMARSQGLLNSIFSFTVDLISHGGIGSTEVFTPLLCVNLFLYKPVLNAEVCDALALLSINSTGAE